MNPYVVFLLYLLATLSFVAITLGLNAALGPKPVASAIKLLPFECGATPVSTVNVKAVSIRRRSLGARQRRAPTHAGRVHCRWSALT